MSSKALEFGLLGALGGGMQAGGQMIMENERRKADERRDNARLAKEQNMARFKANLERESMDHRAELEQDNAIFNDKLARERADEQHNRGGSGMFREGRELSNAEYAKAQKGGDTSGIMSKGDYESGRSFENYKRQRDYDRQNPEPSSMRRQYDDMVDILGDEDEAKKRMFPGQQGGPKDDLERRKLFNNAYQSALEKYSDATGNITPEGRKNAMEDAVLISGFNPMAKQGGEEQPTGGGRKALTSEADLAKAVQIIKAQDDPQSALEEARAHFDPASYRRIEEALGGGEQTAFREEGEGFVRSKPKNYYRALNYHRKQHREQDREDKEEFDRKSQLLYERRQQEKARQRGY